MMAPLRFPRRLVAGTVVTVPVTPPVAVVDPYVVAFAASVTGGGGTLSAAQQGHLSSLYTKLVSESFWPDLFVVNLFLPGAEECRFNFRDASKYTFTYPAGIIANAAGVTGNGTTQYYNTNFTPSLDAVGYEDNLGIDVFEELTSTDGTLFSFGVSDYNGRNFDLLRSSVVENKTTLSGFANSSNSSPAVSLGYRVNAKTLLSMQRTASNAVQLFQFGRKVSENSTAGNGLANMPIYGLAKDSGNNPFGFISGTHKHFVIRKSMSEARVERLNQLLAEYHVATGREQKAKLFFGDSITHGLNNSNAAGSWAKQFAFRTNAFAQNWAVSGSRADEWLTDFSALQTPTYNAAIHDRAYFAWGTNDILAGKTAAEFAATTTSILNLFLAKGWPASKLVIVPAFYQKQDNGGAARLQYIAALTTVANDLGAGLLNLYALMKASPSPDNLFPADDGVHPSDAGQLVIGDLAFGQEPPSASAPPATTLFAPGGQAGTSVKLNYDQTQGYYDTNARDGIPELFDGNEDQPANFGNTLNPSWMVSLPFKRQANTRVDKVRLKDTFGTADGVTVKPLQFFYETWDNPAIVPFGEPWYGTGFGVWTEIALPGNIHPRRIGVLCTSSQTVWPAQLEIWGAETPVAKVLFNPLTSPRWLDLGINGNIFDRLQTNGAENGYGQILESKHQQVRAFGRSRWYCDVNDFVRMEEHPATGVVSEVKRISPEYHGWDFFGTLTRIKADGDPEPLFELINNFESQSVTHSDYPGNNSSMPRAAGASPTAPESYRKIAELGFDLALWGGTDTGKGYTLADSRFADYASFSYQAPPVKRIYTGLLTGMGLLNEPTLSFRGVNSYARPQDYAAALSAFVDGNKGLMGPRVGVKTADPNFKVRMGASDDPNHRWLRAMIHESGRLRGYLPNGEPDCPIDEITYHAYARDTATGEGVRFETSELLHVTQQYRQTAFELLPNTPVSLTEMGYANQEDSTGYHVDGYVQRYSYCAPTPELTTDQRIGAWSLCNAYVHASLGIGQNIWYALRRIAPAGVVNPDWDQVCQLGGLPTEYMTIQARGLFPPSRKFAGYLANAALDPAQVVRMRWAAPSSGDVEILWRANGPGTIALNLPAGVTLYRHQFTGNVPIIQTLAAGSQTIAVGEIPCYLKYA